MTTHVSVTPTSREDVPDNEETLEIHLNPFVHGGLDGVVWAPGLTTRVFPSSVEAGEPVIKPDMFQLTHLIDDAGWWCGVG